MGVNVALYPKFLTGRRAVVQFAQAGRSLAGSRVDHRPGDGALVRAASRTRRCRRSAPAP